MSLQDILDHRHAVRHYDPAQPIDAGVVKKCIELASLAPTSSNMQLWEAFHVTDKTVLGKLAHALFGSGVRHARHSKSWFSWHGRVFISNMRRLFLMLLWTTSTVIVPKRRKKNTWSYRQHTMPSWYRLFYSRCFGLWGTCAQGAGTMYRTFSSYHAAGERERCASLRT